MLRYFTGICLDACSIQPVHFLKIKKKFCTLEQNIEFQNLYKQALSIEELHMEKGKHILISQCISSFLFFTSCLQSCSQSLSGIYNFKSFDVPNNLKLHCSYVLEFF